MATRKDNEYFISDLIPTDLLDQAVAYIRDNVEPEDVYAEQTLFDWAGAGDPEQVFKIGRASCRERVLRLV